MMSMEPEPKVADASASKDVKDVRAESEGSADPRDGLVGAASGPPGDSSPNAVLAPSMNSGGPAAGENALTAGETTAPGFEELPLVFPNKLFRILEDNHSEGIIEWLPHGMGWIIRDKKRFASEVLPKHFAKQSKFTSFTRKLNRWNFTRVTRGPEMGAYYHPLFRRENQKLSLQMTCIQSKSPQQLEPLDPVALGLGIAPHEEPRNSRESPQSAFPVVLPPSRPYYASESSGPVTIIDLKPSSEQPAIFVGETSANAEASHVRLSALSRHTGSNVQPHPPITPYQSLPLSLPPKPKQARKKTGAEKAKGPKGQGGDSAGSHKEPVATA